MAITSFFKRNWIHFAAVGLFLFISVIYFSKQWQGYALKQHDIEQYIGSSHEIADYREHHDGQEPLWTNAMFGGMPATQISVIYDGNLFSAITTGFFSVFQGPLGVVFLYMLCFYAAMVMMGINRWAAVIGAVAFGFLSYDIIIVQAGHNSKAVAIAYMAPVIGAFVMAYRRNWLLGAALSALFMAFEMAANHLQVTYYMGFLILGLGIVELVRAIVKKSYMPFLKASGGVLVAYLLAVAVNYGNIGLTTDYAKQTIRGANDITIAPDGLSNQANSTEGLDRDYVTQYSLGLDESFTLLSPYVKGGGTMAMQNSPFVETAENSDLAPEQFEAVMGSNAYWGDQPSVSGPVYLGVILVFLALLGMVYVKDPIKYALLGAAIITLFLSWGKNLMGLTDFFLDHVPGYDKFRAVTIILVIVELCVPIIAVMFLDRLIRERENIKLNIRPFYYATGAFVLFLIIVKFAGIDKNHLSERELDPQMRARQEESVRRQIASLTPDQARQNGIDINNPQQIQQIVDSEMQRMDESLTSLTKVRENIFQSSMNRSILFTVLAALCLYLLFATSIPTMAIMGVLGVLILVDLVGVTRNYLNNEEEGAGYKYWEEKLNVLYPIFPEEGDLQIMEAEMAANPMVKREVEKGKAEGRNKAMELEATSAEQRRIESAYAFAALNRATNYRVFDLSGQFSSARASYLHKSLGGYHGAKLRSIQNLYDFHLSRSNNRVFDMLNVKYFMQPDQSGALMAQPNPTALGNGWFVKKLNVVPDANSEIFALGSKFDMKNAGNGQFFVNGKVKSQAIVYGSEKLQYLQAGMKDTINVPLANGITEGTEVAFVADANGNTNLVPLQTLLADTAQSFKLLVQFKVADEFKPAEEAVVSEKEAKKLSARSYNGTGSVIMTKYAPNKLNYTVNASDKGLAVFSEVYYDGGWTATIDGKPADIVRVNYLLRGLEIPKGTHKVEFSFDIPKYHTFNFLSRIFSLITLLLFIGACWYTNKRRKNGQTQDTVDMAG